MKERLVNGYGTIPAHNQAAEVAEPSDRALDDPTATVAAQGTSVLRGRPDAPASVRSKINSMPRQ